MNIFSIDIEKYYDELSQMNRQLKGIICIQYPIYCIHSEITDSTPDPLDNLDNVIVDFLKIKPDFNSFQIGSIMGTSKSLVDLRLDKLVRDGLLIKTGSEYILTEQGIFVFETKTHLRAHKLSYDFYIDGITLQPLPKVFYNYYRSKLFSENQRYLYTNSKGETKIARPFAPDIVHTPPEKNKISELIYAIDKDKRILFGIPVGLQTINEVSFTKMSFHLLVSISKSTDGLMKELIDGYAIYSLREENSYYKTLRRNVVFFEPTMKDRIQNLEFKLVMPLQKKECSDKTSPYLTTNWPEIDRYKDSHNKCFNFSREDLINFLETNLGLKYLDQKSIIYEDDTVEINIRKNTLIESPNRKKLISDLIRKRDYRIYSNNLDRNVFLFYLYYHSDDPAIMDLIGFIKLVHENKCLSFTSFQRSHPEYNDKAREYLILAGELDILEKFDIENHMISL